MQVGTQTTEALAQLNFWAATEKVQMNFLIVDYESVRNVYSFISFIPIHPDDGHCGLYDHKIPVPKRSLRPSWVPGRIVSPGSSSNMTAPDAFPLRPSDVPRLVENP
jgi:hypothetical protein